MSKNYIFRTHNLEKKYGQQVVLNNLNLSLEKGKIYGLIGKNGAGKTTFMRLMCKLSFPTGGSIELFGKTNEKEYTNELAKVGVLIEYPSLYGKMTAKENLRMNQIIRGVKTTESEEELLSLVGLGDVGKKKVKDFSLGMRQRLGIAIAVQSNPELLILDEPVNGLDPIGVIEIRKLIKELNEKRGMTILISSHNLPELYQTATDYIILDKGVVKKVISQDELEQECRNYIEIECDDAKKLATFVKQKLQSKESKEKDANERNVEIITDKKVRLYNFNGEEKEEIMALIYKSDCKIYNFSTNEESLENYFVKVIGEVENV